MCKSRPSYRKEWELKYPWVYCNDPQKGMLCQKRRNLRSTARARGAWTTRAVKYWYHATEQLKEHSQLKVAQRFIPEWQTKENSRVSYSFSGRQLLSRLRRDEQRHRSIYFLAPSHLPLTTTFRELLQLQITKFFSSMLKRRLRMLSTPPIFLQ